MAALIGGMGAIAPVHCGERLARSVPTHPSFFSGAVEGLVTDQIALARHANLEYRRSLIEDDRRATTWDENRPRTTE